MLLKHGVNPNFSKLQLGIFSILDEVFYTCAKRECIITSANDGKHMPTSFHYKDRALDLRDIDLPANMITAVVRELIRKLPKGWQVIKESNHIHIEYDPK